jgi:hypothetical protein
LGLAVGPSGAATRQPADRRRTERKAGRKRMIGVVVVVG